ncbi:MAG: glycosyltransferase family 2 protein [Candidatus Diapherotrites archaeon]|nr:glycosyltransferase family 2 protein [Candidatus Diapherotrites archaeon]
MPTHSQDFASVVIPAHNEEKNIPLLYKKLSKVMQSNFSKYELIFVLDGSTDSSKSLLKKLQNKDSHIITIYAERQLGKSKALQLGFEKAAGSILATIDCDMQNDPNDIPKLTQMLDENCDLTCGWRNNRKDEFEKLFFSRIYNTLTRLVTGIQLPDFNCGLKVYKAKVAKAVHLDDGMHRFVPALAKAKGFSIAETKITHHQRAFGKSNYGYKRLFEGFCDLIKVKIYTMRIESGAKHLKIKK